MYWLKLNVWLARDTLYPGSRSKWKLLLNKIASSVDLQAKQWTLTVTPDTLCIICQKQIYKLSRPAHLLPVQINWLCSTTFPRSTFILALIASVWHNKVDSHFLLAQRWPNCLCHVHLKRKAWSSCENHQPAKEDNGVQQCLGNIFHGTCMKMMLILKSLTSKHDLHSADYLKRRGLVPDFKKIKKN